MGAFMIFVQGATAPISREQLQSLGLSHAFDGVPNHAQMDGPGGSGLMLANVPKLDPNQPVYRPDEQVWLKAPKSCCPKLTWHLGYYKDAMPTAADLLRARAPVAGDDVVLAGQPWTVPMVKTTALGGETLNALPCYIELDEEGEPRRGDVVDELVWLLERITPFWNAWVEGYEAAPEEAEHFTLQLPDSIFDDAAAVLSAKLPRRPRRVSGAPVVPHRRR